MDQMNLSAWENRTETRSGGLGAQVAGMACATLNRSGPALAFGDVMPPLWHWFAFLPDTPTRELGADGHPPLGDFLPAVHLNRRMWAGGQLVFLKPLHVGEPLSRRSTIRKIAEKTGAAGQMVFVTVDHEISGEDGVAIREQQDIVYLSMPDNYVPPRRQAALEAPDFAEEVSATPTLLFRYSSLTFNAHRIHYDLPYAQDVEKYPGLVVHGPLQATLLIDAAVRHQGRAPQQFSFRGVHPAFAGEELSVMGQRDETGGLTMCTAVTDGAENYQAMQAQATWEDQI